MSSYQAWKPVPRPSPNHGPPQLFATSQPPDVAPKPGGKMLVYVYEAPKESGPSSSNIHYPRSDECVRFQKARWKKRARKVFPETRPSITTKGGKMFDQQRKRMNNYIRSSPDNNLTEYESDIASNRENDYSTLHDANYTSTGNIYAPAPPPVSNNMQTRRNRKMTGPVIRALRSPPPEWRAKVEANYKLPVASGKPTSVRRRTESYEAGYYSAPGDDESFYDYPEEGFEHFHPSSATSGQRPRHETQPAMFYFNAKQPHHVQRYERSAFVCTPYAHNDFNARPVGWSEAFVANY